MRLFFCLILSAGFTMPHAQRENCLALKADQAR